MKYNQPEAASGPRRGMPGFTTVSRAIEQFEAARFGFGAKGKSRGAFYDFDTVTKETPNPSLSTRERPTSWSLRARALLALAVVLATVLLAAGLGWWRPNLLLGVRCCSANRCPHPPHASG
jgi:hypothetical protein